ncbi:MAG: hypothetical protein ACTSXQ_04930 [Alphaproteobacteria bacterium]
MKKIILTDVDGVLLNWEVAFDTWLRENGQKIIDPTAYKIYQKIGAPTKEEGRLVAKKFNESARIGFLEPLRDAVHYVQKLAAEGWEFHALTSMSNDPYAQKLRMMNLETVFGTGIFTKLACTETGMDKDEILAPYKDSNLFWLEDKTTNADLGKRLGLRSVLIAHPYNENGEDAFPRVEKWEELYKIISEESPA